MAVLGEEGRRWRAGRLLSRDGGSSAARGGEMKKEEEKLAEVERTPAGERGGGATAETGQSKRPLLSPPPCPQSVSRALLYTAIQQPLLSPPPPSE